MSAVLATIEVAIVRQALDLLARNRVGQAQLLLHKALGDADPPDLTATEFAMAAFAAALERCPVPVNPISQSNEE